MQLAIKQVNPKRKSEDRYYEVDGERYDGVTSVLKIIASPALTEWKVKRERQLIRDVAIALYNDSLKLPSRMKYEAFVMSLDNRLPSAAAYNETLETTRLHGNALHAYIEWYLYKRLGVDRPKPESYPEILWAIAQFESWAKSVEFRPIFLERTVASPLYKFAGTLDCFAQFTHKGKRIFAVVDWKTSAKIYETNFLQSAAYAQALDELYGELEEFKDVHTAVVRLGRRENDFELKVEGPGRTKDNLAIFLSALSIYRWSKSSDSSTWTDSKVADS